MGKVSKKMNLRQKVAGFLIENNLNTSRKPLLVAVSGGPDSVCLLHILNAIKKDLGLRLQVVHLDHRLRGSESVEDAQYVLDLCHELGIPVTIERRDVRIYRKEHKLTLEEAAREVRYRFFTEAAKSIGARCVAIGHTLDDHTETILLNLLRGTGTRGLRGLQPIRHRQNSDNQITVIRPLLGVSRKDTVAYCRRHHLQPRTDITNLSIVPTRNRIRLKLLPLLKDYNPDIVEALTRTAEIAGDDIAFLEQTAERYWRRIASKQDGVIAISKLALLKLPRALQRLILRRAIEVIIGTLKDIEARHIEEMVSLLSKPAGRQISLPYGLFFAVEYDRFLLGKKLDDISPFPLLDNEYPLTVPGTTEIAGWRIDATIKRSIKTGDGSNLTANLDYSCLSGQLSVRPRRPGDRFQPLGMDDMKKVGRFMIDAFIPRLWRTRVPLVCDEEKVLWVVGYRIDERVKVTENTKRILQLQFSYLK